RISRRAVSLLEPNVIVQSSPVMRSDPGSTIPRSVTFDVPDAHPVVVRVVALGTVAVTTVDEVAAFDIAAAHANDSIARAAAWARGACVGRGKRMSMLARTRTSIRHRARDSSASRRVPLNSRLSARKRPGWSGVA